MAKRTSLTQLGVLVTVVLAALTFAVLPAAAQDTGRIEGVVYSDVNDNGTRDAGENGVQGVQVSISSGAASQTVTTGTDGTFTANVAPGTWTITVSQVPAGYFPIEEGSTQVTVGTGGDAVSSVEFSLVPRPAGASTTDDAQAAAAEGDEVLPASGGAVPGPVLIGGLAVVLVLGAVLVLVGQRRREELD